MHRPLFVAHYFPPLGGAGVQRTVKFIKNLRALDFHPVVVTSAQGTPNRWEPIDATLARDIPDDVPIVVSREPLVQRNQLKWSRRVRRLVSSNDPSRRRWVRSMEDATASACTRYACDCLIVTMSPFELAELGANMSAKLDLPWIADLRDPWALDEIQLYPTGLHRYLELKKMRTLLATASLIIMNTPEAAKTLLSACPEFKNRPVVCITNGYDIDDFATAQPVPADGYFRVVHSGYLHTEAARYSRRQRLVNTMLARSRVSADLLTRSHVYLLAALERLIEHNPRAREYIRVHLLGVVNAADCAAINRSRVSDMFVLHGYQPHDVCTRWLKAADLLFLPMHSLPDGACSTIVPGKTYEYMASGRPILAAVPEGDAKMFLESCGTAGICRPDDVECIERVLQARFRAWLNGEPQPASNRPFVEQFERKRLTRRLADGITNVLYENADERCGPTGACRPGATGGVA